MSRAGIRAQISSAEAQTEECSRKIDRLQREVTELTGIRPAVNRAAEETGELAQELNAGVMTQERWEGERRRQYRLRTAQELIKPYDNYKKGIEEVLEELNDAIKKKEEEIRECRADIVSLRSRISFLHEELARQDH